MDDDAELQLRLRHEQIRLLARNVPALVSGTLILGSGAAALLWSTAPASDPLTIKQRILASVDKVAGLSGKVQTGGRLNLAKMLTANRVR